MNPQRQSFLSNYFKENSLRHVLVTYVRKNGKPQAVFVAIKIGDEISIGYSQCNKTDVFDRKYGIYMALERAKKGSVMPLLPSSKARKLYELLYNRAHKYFKA
jgi:hypothetical protein